PGTQCSLLCRPLRPQSSTSSQLTSAPSGTRQWVEHCRKQLFVTQGRPGEIRRSHRSLHQLLNEGAAHVCWYSWVTIHQRACLQYWLSAVQSGHISALKEFPNRYLVTPAQRFFHGGYPVGRVMSRIVFQLLHPRSEPLVGVVVVISDAGAEDIEKGKTLVQNALPDQFCQVLLLATKAAGNESRPSGQSHRNRVDWRFDVAERHAFRLHTDAAGR